MDDDHGVPRWQMAIAVVGVLLWLLLLSAAQLIKDQGWLSFYRFLSGYTLGFVVALAGFILWEFLNGRGRRLLDPHPFFRWFSYVALLIIMLFGLAGLLAEIFGNTDWRYNLGSVLGGVVVGAGLLPVFEKYDRRAP